MRTALYRYFDSDGVLLYVGITSNPLSRDAQHRGESTWIEAAARVAYQWLESKEHAAALERVAIRFEKPLHNVNCADIPQTGDVSGREADLLSDIRAAAERLNVSPTTLGRLAGQGGKFYTRLLSGASIRAKTAEAVRAWIAQNVPEAA